VSIADTTVVFAISWNDCRVLNHYVKLITSLTSQKVSVNQSAIDCEVLTHFTVFLYSGLFFLYKNSKFYNFSLNQYVSIMQYKHG